MEFRSYHQWGLKWLVSFINWSLFDSQHWLFLSLIGCLRFNISDWLLAPQYQWLVACASLSVIGCLRFNISDWLLALQYQWLVAFIINWLLEPPSLTHWFPSLTDWFPSLIDCLSHWLIQSLIDCLSHWLIPSVIDSIIDCSHHWFLSYTVCWTYVDDGLHRMLM